MLRAGLLLKPMNIYLFSKSAGFLADTLLRGHQSFPRNRLLRLIAAE